jgi:hypothetical protein
MAGTLSATVVLPGVGVAPFNGGGTLSVDVAVRVVVPAVLAGNGYLDVASALALYHRGAALTGSSDLMCSPKQIYQFFANLFGGGSLGGAVNQTRAAGYSGNGSLSAIASGSLNAVTVFGTAVAVETAGGSAALALPPCL